MSEPTPRGALLGLFGINEGDIEIINEAVDAIEQEAVRTYAERLVAAVREMPSGCHDHEGLRCNSDWFDGNCSLIDGAAVIDLIEGSKP